MEGSIVCYERILKSNKNEMDVEVVVLFTLDLRIDM